MRRTDSIVAGSMPSTQSSVPRRRKAIAHGLSLHGQETVLAHRVGEAHDVVHQVDRRLHPVGERPADDPRTAEHHRARESG